MSHYHYDHLDATTLKARRRRTSPHFIAPLATTPSSVPTTTPSALDTFDWGERIELSRNVTVTCVPARHWSARGLFDRNKALWGAFVIETPAGRIYHVADLGYGDGFYFRDAREKYGPFRLAILPIGAYEPRWFMQDQHMNPEDAVQAFRDSGAELALGHHYGTFQLTDEAIDAPVEALDAARGGRPIAPDRFGVLRPGEVWEL